MAADKQLLHALELLQRKVEKLETDAAVALLDKEIAELDNPDWVPHYEVHKASLLRRADRTTEAAQLLQGVIEKYPFVDSANYFAGEYLLELGQYAKAIGFFSNCIAISTESEDDWFMDSAHLLRAYCAAKTGDRLLAIKDLADVSDDEEMSWLSVEPPISKSSILSIIAAK